MWATGHSVIQCFSTLVLSYEFLLLSRLSGFIILYVNEELKAISNEIPLIFVLQILYRVIHIVLWLLFIVIIIDIL